MLIIEHRKNTIDELVKVPVGHGVEIDVRSVADRLILNHDPFTDGELFEDWLEHYRHNLLILNVKEEGLEQRIKSLMEERGIVNFFFLDLSFPFIVKQIKAGEKRIAVRFSEYESIETCLSLAGKVEWVWVDCFDKFPLDQNAYRRLSKHFRLCLVSPELVGRTDDIEAMKTQTVGMKIDAVCTKYPKEWEQPAG